MKQQMEKSKLRKLLLVAGSGLLLCGSLTVQPVGSAAQKSVAPAVNVHDSQSAVVRDKATSPEDQAVELRQQSFEIVWRTVKDKHFDPTFGGVNWEQVRDNYAPRVAAVKTNQELYRVLQEMLGELHQSHFNIIPPEAVIPDDAKEPPTGGVGIDLRLLSNAAVITRVEAGSSAERAGLRPGFAIKQVGEKTVAQIAEPYARSNDQRNQVPVRVTRKLLSEINGEPGTTVALSFTDEKERTRNVTLTREKLKGELSARLGNWPPQYTEFEMKRLAGNIGYIRFNIFTIPIVEKARTAIRSLSDADGVIFDLRGNPGGVAGIATSIASQLSRKPGALGTMKMRASEMKFSIYPQPNAYDGPVVILLDGLSGSTSEVFSSGMQELGRAIIVGERSAGACLPSAFQKLPTGALFQYAIADFKTPKGVLVEGRGVIPDIEVKWERASLLSGRDAQLEAGIAALAHARKPERGEK